MSGLTVLADTEIVHVGDVAEQVRGVSYSKADVRTAPQPGYVPLLRGGNVREHGLAFDDLQFVPDDGVSQKQILRAGDIVVVASSGSLSGVGKAACVPSGFHGTFGAFCKVIRPTDKIDASYLGHYFRTADYRSKVSSMAGGANINNLRNEHLDGLKIRLPALHEQRRIAAILDKADELRTKRRQALVHLDALTQSIFDTMFGDPVNNSRGWPQQKLNTLGLITTGNTPARAVRENFGDYIEWVKTDNINTSRTVLTPAREGLSEQGVRKARVVPPGSVLVTCIAGSPGVIGNVALVDRTVAFNQQINAFTPHSGPGLYWYTLLKSMKPLVQKASSGGMKGLVSKSVLSAIDTIVVPDAVQTEFAERLAAVERLKSHHESQLAELDTLFASLQHRAFRGEL